MDRVYEFREQGAKAKQELVAQQEENKELKMRMEQVPPFSSPRLFALKNVAVLGNFGAPCSATTRTWLSPPSCNAECSWSWKLVFRPILPKMYSDLVLGSCQNRSSMLPIG